MALLALPMITRPTLAPAGPPAADLHPDHNGAAPDELSDANAVDANRDEDAGNELGTPD